ncbi:VIT and vWA domain-containing protein [Chondromyces apiculatus]|uniref:VWFA domain-containing protein n=1 Tax=Chondromyces apiculatus DSM 436 TaxID=1192034 RepID=A0A017SU66_9BACT|nr:VIT and VWA domain-containing protein [Chondromyces apiculatus]EYF00518.1 Hypothetical protein CAP_0500 [Chondromyces apiculatus DSM 436]
MFLSDERVTQGSLRTSAGAPLPLEHTDVKAHLAGPVARVEVKQVFRNDTGQAIDAVYLFPLPHGASVYAMRFRIGARVVEAVVKEKEEARRTYEAARREGRSATLLEQDRPNLFTLSVANIPEGEAIEVELAYQERLAFDEGEFRFVFPMVTADRYHPCAPTGSGAQGPGATPIEQAPDATRIRPPRAATGQRAADIAVEVEIHADASAEPPRSPSHRIDLTLRGPGRFHARLHEADSLPNRDFVLAYAAAAHGIRPKAYFERKPDRVGTFLLVVTPPVALPEEPPSAERDAQGATALRCTNCGGALRDPEAVRDYPDLGKAFRCAYCGVVVAVSREGATVGLPRDVIILVDRSCSMRGGSIPQARRAVRMILDHLDPRDAVQCFAFDHERIAADGRGSDYLPLDPTTLASIDALLGASPARGGTELEEALQRAAELPVRPGRTRLVVLITDAALGNEGRLLRRAPEILGAATRLYVLGLGPAVNRYLVERLARAGGGASDVLLPDEDVETVVPRFARRVRQAGPVLRKIRLAWEHAVPLDVYPNPIPELFGGQTVQLLGRFSGEGKSRLVLTGELATGAPFRQEIDVTLPEVAEDIPGLDRLWARLRIDARLARLEEAPGEAAEVRLEVLSLALKHALLSPYTALVAEDSERRVKAPAPPAEGAAREAKEDGRAEDAEKSARGGEERMRRAKKIATWDEAEGGASSGAMPIAALELHEVRDDSLADEPSPDIGGHAPPPPPAMAAPSRPGMAAPPPPALRAPPPPLAAAPLPAAAPARARLSMPLPSAPPAPSPALPSPEPPAPPSPAFGAAGLSAPLREKGGGGLLSKVKSFFTGSKEDDDDEVSGSGMDFMAAEESSLRKPASPSAVPPLPRAATSKGRARQQVPGTEAYTREMLKDAADRAIGELDLVFLVDETGSMGDQIEQVKVHLLELIEALKAAPLCRSLRLGLVSYRDHPPQERTFVSRTVPLTEDIASIQQGVQRMEASGGGDGPEAVTDGLFDLVRLGWRPRAARVVVWVGDAPPHGVVPEGDGFPGGCPCGHHWYTQAESCREMGIVVHAVGCLPNLAHYVGAVEVFKTVASTTRGLYLPLTEAGLLIPLILSVAETELDKQRIEEHIADILARHEEALRLADEQERVRFVTDVLRDQNVRPRSASYGLELAKVSPQRFREIAAADVAGGLDQLRRLGRTTL